VILGEYDERNVIIRGLTKGAYEACVERGDWKDATSLRRSQFVTLDGDHNVKIVCPEAKSDAVSQTSPLTVVLMMSSAWRPLTPTVDIHPVDDHPEVALRTSAVRQAGSLQASIAGSGQTVFDFGRVAKGRYIVELNDMRLRWLVEAGYASDSEFSKKLVVQDPCHITIEAVDDRTGERIKEFRAAWRVPQSLLLDGGSPEEVMLPYCDGDVDKDGNVVIVSPAGLIQFYVTCDAYEGRRFAIQSTTASSRFTAHMTRALGVEVVFYRGSTQVHPAIDEIGVYSSAVGHDGSYKGLQVTSAGLFIKFFRPGDYKLSFSTTENNKKTTPIIVKIDRAGIPPIRVDLE
jgi:hypothetical protein